MSLLVSASTSQGCIIVLIDQLLRLVENTDICYVLWKQEHGVDVVTETQRLCIKVTANQEVLKKGHTKETVTLCTQLT